SVYDDVFDAAASCPPAESVVCHLEAMVSSAGALLVDVYLVRGGRWWSRRRDARWGTGPGCDVALTPTAFAAAATVAGLTALPSRQALVAALDPCDKDERD